MRAPRTTWHASSRTTFSANSIGSGFRGLRRTPGFAAAVVVSLALGVAGVTSIFSVVNAVVVRALPYPDADRLQLVRVAWNEFSASLSDADFLRLPEAAAGSGARGQR
jgi:hypothetical protein